MTIANYPLISTRTSFTLISENVTEAEIQEYFNWFMSEIDGRVQILTDLINGENIEKNWAPDLTRASLPAVELLIEKYAEQVAKTKQEISEERKSIVDQRLRHVVSDWKLSELTISLCFDTGIYFGECLRKSVVGLKWEPCLDSKNSAYFGYPVLVRQGCEDELLPQSVMEVFARKIVKDTKGKFTLQGLFDANRDGFLG